MTTTIRIAPVRKTVRVATGPERAFELFTAGMKRWWPEGHSLLGEPVVAIVVEPQAGGRWFERGESGREYEWGKVLSWDPPGRVLLAWQLDTQWQYDKDLLTELEIRFVADGDGTVVELEHRLDGYGAAAEQMKAALEGPDAWEGILNGYAAVVG